MRSGKRDNDCVGDFESISIELYWAENLVERVGCNDVLLAADWSLDLGANDGCFMDEVLVLSMSTDEATNDCDTIRDTVTMYEI
jgi:hypothetical protein